MPDEQLNIRILMGQNNPLIDWGAIRNTEHTEVFSGNVDWENRTSNTFQSILTNFIGKNVQVVNTRGTFCEGKSANQFTFFDVSLKAMVV